jgi:hypothetical protein
VHRGEIPDIQTTEESTIYGFQLSPKGHIHLINDQSDEEEVN